jgi:tetratricopeptide (TPR) repeat protein
MPLNRPKIEKDAEKYLRQGKIDAAIAEYQKLLQESPKDLNTINKIGDLYARHGKTREAIVQFSKIAEFYSADGFLLKAIAIYKKINKLDPNYMEAYQRLADLYSQQGLVMEAKSQYQSVADHYLKAGHLEKTRDVFEKLLKLAPDDLKTRLSIAELYVREKKAEQAIQEYLAIGAELDKRNMLKESVRIYQNAHKLAPANRDVLNRLIKVYNQQGEHDQVIALLKDQARKLRDPGLMALLAQAYVAKDKVGEAKKLLEEASRIDSGALEIRVALGRLQLKQGEVEEAFVSLTEASQKLEGEKKLNEACHLWEEFLREEPKHVEALTTLEDLYRRSEQHAKADARASDLADLLIQKGSLDPARAVLERLVKSDSGNPKHRERLEALKGRRVAPSSAAAKRPASVDMLEEADLPDLGPGIASEADSGEEPAVAPAELEPLAEGGEEEDSEFVSERLTEAEVFVKYGLVDKAVEQVRVVLKRFPRCISARRKLSEIHRDNGDNDAAVRECVQVALLYRQQGEGPKAQEILEEASSMGGSATTQALVRKARGEEASPPAAAIRPAAGKPAPGRKAAPRPSVPLSSPPPEPAETPELELELAPEPSELGDDLQLDLSPEPLEEVSSPRSAAEESLEIEIEAGSDTGPSDQELKEVDFYLEQGLEDEARALLQTLQRRAPGSPEVSKRMARLGKGRPQAGRAAASAAPSGANILADIERELNESLELVPEGKPAGGSSEFFDLASDLDESLLETQTAVEADPDLAGGDDEHSLEEIFKAFKKGVEQQVDSGDYETHYNLGIAYKEMGLVEEAIGEFQIASKDPRRLLECCSMLGLCFKEKGMTNLALKWYQKGLESPHKDEERRNGLKYDLAGLHMEMGDYARAMELFTDVYGMNAKYRDVSQKIRELERLMVHGK